MKRKNERKKERQKGRKKERRKERKRERKRERVREVGGSKNFNLNNFSLYILFQKLARRSYNFAEISQEMIGKDIKDPQRARTSICRTSSRINRRPSVLTGIKKLSIKICQSQ